MDLDPVQSRPANSTADDTDPAIQITEPICAVFRRRLRTEGLKYTPERAMILDTILRFDSLFEAEAIMDTLRDGGFRVSKATVYRTIKLLQEAGIIQKVLFDREQSHYQLVYGRRPNDLLVRMDNGQVETIDIPELVELRDRICRERGLKAQSHRFQIFAMAVRPARERRDDED